MLSSNAARHTEDLLITSRATESAVKPPSGNCLMCNSSFSSFITVSRPNCSANVQPLVRIIGRVASLGVERVVLARGPSSMDAADAATCSKPAQGLLAERDVELLAEVSLPGAAAATTSSPALQRLSS